MYSCIKDIIVSRLKDSSLKLIITEERFNIFHNQKELQVLNFRLQSYTILKILKSKQIKEAKVNKFFLTIEK